MAINFPALDAAKRQLKRILDQAGPEFKNLDSVQIDGCETFAEKMAHLGGLNNEIKQLKSVQAAASGGRPHFEAGHAQGDDGGSRTASGLKGQAMRYLDHHVHNGTLKDYAAERVEKLMSAGTGNQQTISQRWAAAAGDPHYLTAFMKMATDPQRGHMLWTAEEQRAFQEVREVKTAMSLSADHGAEMVPLNLDPAINLTNAGSINPLRRIARSEITSTNTWQGVTSAGATSEWKAEAAQAADGTPDVADKSIPVHFGSVDALYSYEIEMDALNFSNELRIVLSDSVDNLHATAFTTGSGSGQPKGIVTALTGTASEINGGGTEALIAADAFTLQNALPARFSTRAQWTAHIATMNTFRQFETTNGALKFPELAGNPPMLLSKPFHENSNMDGAVNAAATANNYLVIYGDWTNFVIVDRIGASIEFLPNMGANGRPTGQRHAFLYTRTGSDVLIPEAFRMLDVPTTA